jgi:hypothetical protein
VTRLARITTPAPPSRRSIGGQGLRGCLRPSHPAKWGVREGPPRFLRLRGRRFRSHPRLCGLGAARQFSQNGSSDSLFDLEADPLRGRSDRGPDGFGVFASALNSRCAASLDLPVPNDGRRCSSRWGSCGARILLKFLPVARCCRHWTNGKMSGFYRPPTFIPTRAGQSAFVGSDKPPTSADKAIRY